MRKRDALKLANRDAVEIRGPDGWVRGYVLGEPYKLVDRVVVPVFSSELGYQTVESTEVR